MWIGPRMKNPNPNFEKTLRQVAKDIAFPIARIIILMMDPNMYWYMFKE